MAANSLIEAAARLTRHYGRPAAAGPPGAWSTLVRVVLEATSPAKKAGDWSWIDESPLRTPDETAASERSRLEEILEEAGQRASLAGALSGLAKWWLRKLGDTDAPADFLSRSLETWQSELRAIRGVNWELADRILLVVGRLPVYPLDRGSMRIAARHGWVEMTAEYDDWQAFFVGGLRDSDVELWQLSYWNRRMGRDFCGKAPQCEECPLRELLPARGAIKLENEE